MYAISYDDPETLAEFAEKQGVHFPLLSDIDSKVIRQFGILNEQVTRNDALLYGIPYPGVYVTNETGTVVAKFFHDSYKKRESPEFYIDAALGRLSLDEKAPQVSGGDQDINLTIAVHGGNGTVRQGIVRHLVVRFELPEGLHIYGPPVPEGMIATQVTIQGPEGLALMSPELPATEKLTLPGVAELNVWHGTVDLTYPFYATGELASECRPLDVPSIDIKVTVRYQACTDRECLLPKTESFTLSLDLDVIDIPAIDLHKGHGQREGNYDGAPALKRLLGRKIKQNPLGLPIFLIKSLWLQMGALLRKRQQKKSQNKQ
ncbi:MAG TPA: peroxiredoxin [Gammaproteobacteria bacterium]|nr:peroxiredoxin [Gammaproteobacteria bacterium]